MNVLGREQSALSNLFADKKREAIRFDGLDCKTGATGCPRLPGALASLDCTVRDVVDAGDHIVYVGSVEDARIDAEQEPLVYWRGGYQKLRRSRAESRPARPSSRFGSRMIIAGTSRIAPSASTIISTESKRLISAEKRRLEIGIQKAIPTTRVEAVKVIAMPVVRIAWLDRAPRASACACAPG